MRNILFCLIILTACQHGPENLVVVKNFPFTFELQGDSISSFDEELSIMGLYNAGDFILCSSHRNDFHFSVYTKDSLHKVGHILRRGRGAGEFLAPAYFSQYEHEHGEIKVWILERAFNTFFQININKTLENDSLYLEKEYDLSVFKNVEYRDMFVMNEQLLFATEDLQDCKHVYLQMAHKQKKVVPPTLEFANHPTTHDIAQTVSTKHPQKDYIASVFFNFPQIDLYNEQGRYKTIFYKKMIHPQEISTSQRDEEYFSCICCNSNYIFALYHPTPTSAKRISEILIFSWEGHPIGKYVIPFASYLLVDEDNKCIFALNPNKETFNTSIYHLNNMSPTNLK